MTERPSLIRIWQQNLNKSLDAQLDLLHKASPDDYDILLLQEPYIDHLKNTRATRHWRVHYPTVRDPETAGRARSVILINARISTDAWSPLVIPHPDVTAISLKVDGATV